MPTEQQHIGEMDRVIRIARLIYDGDVERMRECGCFLCRMHLASNLLWAMQHHFEIREREK